MRYAYVLLVLAAVFALSCDRSPGGSKQGGEFLGVFLQDGDTGVPVDRELQVYLGECFDKSDADTIVAELETADGTAIPGEYKVRELSMLLVFTPDSTLRPSTDYVLRISSGAGVTRLIRFRTEEGDFQAATLAILEPASGASVSGIVRVTAEPSDPAAVILLESTLDGATTGERADGPFHFYVNTATVADGLHTIEVFAYDPAGLLGSTAVDVTVANGDPTSTPAWIYEEALDPVDGLVPSAPLLSVFPAGGGLVIQVYTATASTYSDLSNDEIFVGEFQAAAGYEAKPDYETPGVVLIRVLNLSGVAVNVPASTLDLVYPDYSALTVYLPAVTVAHLEEVCYYAAADGSSHIAHSGGTPVFVGTAPDLSPSQAMANPPQAP